VEGRGVFAGGGGDGEKLVKEEKEEKEEEEEEEEEEARPRAAYCQALCALSCGPSSLFVQRRPIPCLVARYRRHSRA
jgi:hypothetical protein